MIGSRYARPTRGRRREEAHMQENNRPRLVVLAGGRCQLHPAFEADYCPSCGTAQTIGGTR